MVLPFSGLGLLDDFFVGGTNEAEDGGVMIFEEGRYDAEDVLTYGLVPTTARSELFFVINAGRCGSGGPGLEIAG
jgi:hypothetical protein